MAFPLTAINCIPLSSTQTNVSFTYTNSAREFGGIQLSNIIDVSLNNDSLLFLTQPKTVRGIMDTLYGATTATGYNGQAKFVTYTNDPTVNVASCVNIFNNHLLAVPFKSSKECNIVPLKTNQIQDGEYDLNKILAGQPSRVYDAIYFGNNQEDGYDNVYVQYKSDRVPIHFESDKFTTFYTPPGIQPVPLAQAGFINNGAIAGDSPLNSDVIIFDQEGYGAYGDDGFPNQTLNGIPLCAWLSNTTWKERWYDPNTISQGNAFIAQKSTDETKSYIDIDSTASLKEKLKTTYLRFGPNRNETYVNSFSGKLICNIDQWSSVITDTAHGVAGFANGPYSTNVSDELVMDGKFYMHIPPTANLFTSNTISVNLDVFQDSWSRGINTQYFGNFDNDGGYGLFYNTGSDFELIAIPSLDGNLYGFNYKGNKVFEKNMSIALGLSATRIDIIITDLYGERWIYDSLNQSIYRLDADNLIKFTISLPSDAKIAKMAINSQSALTVLNTSTSRLSSFDPSGNLLGIDTNTNSNFEIDRNDNIVREDADILLIDNFNNRIKAFGINLYKNGKVFFSVGAKIQALNIDSSGNIWVIYKNKNIVKLDQYGNVIFRTTLDLPFDDCHSSAFSFVRETKNGVDVDVGWIVYNTYNYLVKIDMNGRVVKRINLRDVVNLSGCNSLALNVNGDFTGYDAKRKFYMYGTNNAIGVTNPALTLKIALSCGTNRKIVQLHAPVKQLVGWNNIGFTLSINNGMTYLVMFINGLRVASTGLSGNYTVDYGTKVSPFIIGGASGKLESKNSELLYLNTDYFIGKIDNLRIYATTLSDYQMQALNRRRVWQWENMNWYMPAPKRTYLEEIRNFHQNRYHGHKSNFYNIRIKNLDIVDANVQGIIAQSISNVIQNFTPAHTSLNEIFFE